MRWIRALFALLVSLVLLGGVPLLLLKVVGNPWAGLHEMFTAGTMTDQGVLNVLAVLVIGAAAVGWLQFTVAFVAEFSSVRRTVKYGQRATRRRRVPLVFKGQQRLAHSLVTALLLLGPTLFSTLGPGVVAASAVAPTPAVTSSATVSASAWASATYSAPAHQAIPTASSTKNAAHAVKASTASMTVTSDGPRNWWDLAQHYLGAGDRWQQLWNLNQGNVQADGTVMSSSTTPLQAGWSITVPASAVTAAHPLSAPAHTPAPVHVTATPNLATAPIQIVVHPGDTLSGIAQRELGNADLYPELAQANHLADPDDLGVGQTITIPAALIDPAGQRGPAPTTTPASRTVRVQPGDTLTKIAQRELGNPDLYRQLAAANHISDPDNILAGSTIMIPAPTPHPTAPHPAPKVTVSHTAAPPGPHTATTHKAATAPKAVPAIPPKTAPVIAPKTAPAAAPHSPPTQTSAPAPPSATAPRSPIGQNTERPASTTTVAATHVASATNPSVAEIGAGLGAALGAVLLAGIAVARRRKGRKRPVGEVPRPVSLSATRAERHLRERAGGADVVWMDTALRAAAALCADRPVDQLPDVTAVWLSRLELQLRLAAPVPAPLPFIVEGNDWVIATGTDLPDRTETASPFPALVSLGESAGETFLVDLERIGALTITGDEQRTADLLRHIAVEYGHSLWSDHLQVYLVGWGRAVTALRPERLFYAPSVNEIVTLLRGRLQEVLEVQAEGATTVLESRIGDQHTVEDPWTPTILLIDARADEDLEPLAQALRSISGAGRSAVAVVTRSNQIVAGSASAHIEADGILQLPAVLSNHLRVQAAGLTESALDELLELFAAAGQFQEPGPVSDTTKPWSADMSVIGSLIAPAPAVVNASPATAGLPESATNADDSTTDETEEDLPAVVGQVVPLRPALVEAQQVLAKVLSDDVDLDADVEEWWVSAPEGTDPDTDKTWVRRPRIGVLGTPLVLARGNRPPDRINRFTEMSVYLALHREVDAEQFAGDLWPTGETPTGDNRRSYVSRVRTWMGTDPVAGRQYLPTARLKPYRLERLLDIELFRRLRKRADAHLKADDRTRAMTDLCSALDLVRGPVLEQHPRTGYTWSTTNDEADLKDANLMMLETAHLLVDLALHADDVDLARQAADVGYRVDHKADLPLVDHMRIAHQVGDDQKARGWLAALLQANEIELAEDLPNYKTFEAVNEVFPNGLSTAASN